MIFPWLWGFSGHRPARKIRLHGLCLCGELALDGMIRPIKGALSMAITARDIGVKGIFLPAENAREAAVVDGIPIFPVKTCPR